ncbi:phage tail sheath family protein [Streptomyces sp. NPDC101227]|uniref:phage tail sheath family protein n=1 Tax=Streptomyces sp. NPDC101227 TaxID=3366136 RepID=UPI003830018B
MQSIEEITIVVAPDLWSETREEGRKAAGLIADHCQKMGNRVAVLHLPNEVPQKNAPEDLGIETAEAQRYTTVYYPWVTILAHEGDGDSRVVPPTGHVAGVWARVDAERGVHKAPANETLRGVIGLAHDVNDAEQVELNNQGVNAIRTFPGAGILVWGARTLAAADDGDVEHSYINVRRSVNFIKQSILQSTNWVVFEPDDDRLQTSVKAMVASFLTGLWRRGMLVGKSPEEAFYVTCDETNNPPEQVAEGKLLVEIGVALVRPAEFITFQVSQHIKQST